MTDPFNAAVVRAAQRLAHGSGPDETAGALVADGATEEEAWLLTMAGDAYLRLAGREGEGGRYGGRVGRYR